MEEFLKKKFTKLKFNPGTKSWTYYMKRKKGETGYE